MHLRKKTKKEVSDLIAIKLTRAKTNLNSLLSLITQSTKSCRKEYRSIYIKKTHIHILKGEKGVCVLEFVSI